MLRTRQKAAMAQKGVASPRARADHWCRYTFRESDFLKAYGLQGGYSSADNEYTIKCLKYSVRDGHDQNQHELEIGT